MTEQVTIPLRVLYRWRFDLGQVQIGHLMDLTDDEYMGYIDTLKDIKRRITWAEEQGDTPPPGDDLPDQLLLYGISRKLQDDLGNMSDDQVEKFNEVFQALKEQLSD